jgi:hypothetical protein
MMAFSIVVDYPSESTCVSIFAAYSLTWPSGNSISYTIEFSVGSSPPPRRTLPRSRNGAEKPARLVPGPGPPTNSRTGLAPDSDLD